MFKACIIRRLALVALFIIFLTSTINTTFCFIIVKTDSIINTFIPFESIINDLLISKTVEHPLGSGYVIPDNIAFDFKVDFGSLYANTTIKTTAGNIVADQNGSILISVKPNDSFTVENIDVGTKISVTEIQKDGSGFTVKDLSPTLEGVVSEDGILKFDYINIYNPTTIDSKNINVFGTKILEGREWEEGDSFSFSLEQKQSDDSWSLIGEKNVTYNPEKADFNRFDFSDLMHNVTFDNVGTYHFRLKEIVGDLENIDYDKSVKTFAVKVTDIDMNGQLEICSVTAGPNITVLTENNTYTLDVTFNNTFVPLVPDDIELNITIDKTVVNVGGTTFGADGFKFILENTESGEKTAVISNKNGKALFALAYSANDIGKTYNYKLYEVNEGVAGVMYDSAIYNISVNISLDQDNNLTATALLNGEAVDNIVVKFKNIYNGEPIDIPPTGDNSNITFWFVLMLTSGITLIVLLVAPKMFSKKRNLDEKEN